MGKNPPKWLPGDRVNETILVQRKSVEQLNADRLLRRDVLRERRDKHKLKLDSKRKRKLETKKFIPAQTILKHALRKLHQAQKFYKAAEKYDGGLRYTDVTRRAKSFAARNKVVLIVRAKGRLIPRPVAIAFTQLGLEKLYSARLIRLTPRSHKMIKLLKPFAIIGYPGLAQVTELLRTRGAFWMEETKSKRVMTGNLLIEQTLGQYNILCVEDLAAVLTARRPVEHLDEILKTIAPFDLHPPRQLFVERHRSVHQKLEIVNPASFAAYLAEMLRAKGKVDKKAKKKAQEKRNARKKSAQTPKEEKKKASA